MLALVTVGYAQQASSRVPFQFLGRYDWEKRSVISHTRPLPDITHKTTVAYRTETLQPASIPHRKIRLYQNKKGILFTPPPATLLTWKATPVGVFSKTTAPPFSVRDNADFPIDYMDKAHGMIADEVTAIAEDTFHRIWMGTSEGLVQYDGHCYRVYTTQSGLLSNSITHVRYDVRTGLWIATSEGLQLLRQDTLYEPNTSTAHPAWNVVATNTDSYGNQWVNTSNAGSICMSLNLRHCQQFDTACGLPGNAIKYALLDRKQHYWFAGYGLVHIEGNTLTHWYSGKEHFNSDEWLTLLEDEETMWAGTFDNGLLKITDKDTLQMGITAGYTGRVFSIIKSKHALWFTLYGGGVGQIKGNQYQRYHRENGLSGAGAYHLLQDAYGNIWVSTLDAGWSRINHAAIVPDRQVPGNWHPASIHQDNNGGRWFFLNGGGLRRVSGNSITLITNNSQPPIPSVMHFMDGIINNDGTAWLASYSYGIAFYDRAHLTFHYFSDQPTDRVVLAAVKDGEERPWFSTLHFGLVFAQGASLYHVSSKDRLLTDKAGPLTIDASGAVISLSSKGVQRIYRDTLYDCFFKGARLDVEAVCCRTLRNGVTLIGTSGQGLLMMKSDSLFRISSWLNDGSPLVSSILEDSSGLLWLTTKSGMITGRISQWALSEMRLLDRVGRHVINQIIPVGYIDENNLPHWATNKGMLVYAPDDDTVSQASPGMRFLAARVNDSLADLTRPLVLYPNDQLMVEYASIHWGSDPSAGHQYIVVDLIQKDTVEAIALEGGLIKWQQREPGDYCMLLVRQLGGTKYYSSPMYFSVYRYWYNTWWFYGVCMLVLIGLVVFYFTVRSRRLQRAKVALEEAVNTRTAELTAAVEDRNMLLKEMHHRVKNNLQIISGLLALQKEEFVDESLKQAFTEGQSRLRSIALIHQNLYEHQDLAKIHFKAFVTELLQYMQEVFEDKNKRLEVQVDGPDIYFGSDVAVPLGLIINELLTNAYKYAGDRSGLAQVALHLKKRPDGKCELVYTDQGPGIPNRIDFDSAGTLGLRLIKGLMAQIGGTITYHYSNGAVFTMVFIEAKKLQD
ncbi:MAG: histidine kinase dimerization/phosphoacceptor domain -containing protein [Chitinophagales bacterium]